MQIYEFEIEVITPMIMRGAKNQPEFRITSLIGVLRWWLRTQCANAIEAHKVEEEIFGSTNKASSVKLSYLQNHQNGIIKEHKKWEDSLYYLNHNFSKNGHAFASGSKFYIRMMVGKLEDKYLNMLLNSFKLLAMFGGLGARSRRGYGSVQIKMVSSTVKGKKNDFNLYIEVQRKSRYFALCEQLLNEFSVEHNSNINKYCQLSNANFVYDTKDDNGYTSYEAALEKVIEYMKEARSSKSPYNVDSGYKKDIKPLLAKYKGKFEKKLQSNLPLKVENLVFGYPLTYQSKFLKSKVPECKTISAEITSDERFASPVLISITKLNDIFYPTVLYFNTDHLNINTDINVKITTKYNDKKIRQDRVRIKSNLIYDKNEQTPLAIHNFLSKFK